MKNLKYFFFFLVVFIYTTSTVMAQTESQLNTYRTNFDRIIYSATTDNERIAKIKTEIPAVFFEKKGFYALTKAMEFRSIPFLEFILSQKGVDINSDADYTHENILNYLPWDNYSTVKPGTCTLTDTLFNLRKQLAIYLVKKGAKINHIDANGGNIMQKALYKKDLDFLKFLYELNNNQLVNPPAENLLYYASYIGCIDFTVWLLEKGVDVNMPNKYEGSAIGAAVRRPEIVRYLIQKGANVNLANGYGWTPLMYAANYGNMESVKMLIEAGANINATNSKGWDVLQVAKEYKQREVIKYIKSLKK